MSSHSSPWELKWRGRRDSGGIHNHHTWGKNTQCGWFGATSGCVRRHSRELPAGAPEGGRARSRYGWRRSGPGRCRRCEAPRPCVQERNRLIINYSSNQNENTVNSGRIESLSNRLAMKKVNKKLAMVRSHFTPRTGFGSALFPYHRESRNGHFPSTTHFAGLVAMMCFLIHVISKSEIKVWKDKTKTKQKQKVRD